MVKSFFSGSTLAIAATSIWLSTGGALPADHPRVMFILDASNSMWGQIEGLSKIDVAKDVLSDVIATLPPDARIGLVAYGHGHDHKQKNCHDIELVAQYDTAASGHVASLLAGITPRGQTPIAAALGRSVDWVAAEGAERPTVVLITDGVESCNGDPCVAASKLAAAGIETTIHVVGYDLREEQRASIDCIARIGGGEYFDARDTAGLRSALEKVSSDIVEASAQANALESRTIHFEDDFGGNTLSRDWTVINEDDSAYIVEDDHLLMIGAGEQGLWVKEAANIFQLDNKLPIGDWDLNVDLRIDMQTGEDSFELGLFKDDQNYMAADLYHHRGEWCHKLELALFKRVKGRDTSASTLISSNSGHCGERVHGDVEAVLASLANDGIRLTLSKRAREYFATATLRGLLNENDPRSVQTPALSSLRTPGNPVIAIGNYKEVDGEVLGYVDRVEIISID